MSGFPTRPLRSAFGPTFRDPRPIEHPEHEIGADQLNLIVQVVTAAGLLLPAVSLVAEWNAGTSEFDYLHQEEAWNVDHSQTHPTLTRVSAGVYEYQLADNYLDKDGNSVAVAMSAARISASAGEDFTAEAWIDGSDATLVQIRTYDDGSAADCRFWLEVL